MKKSKINRKKKQLTIDKVAPKVIMVIVAVFIALFAVQLVSSSNAAKPIRAPRVPSVYLNPTKSTSNVGAIVSLDLRETSGTVPVNAFEITVDYPAELLELVEFVPNQATFAVGAEYTPSPGSVTIARGSTTTLSGDQHIGVFTFKVIAKGTANISVNQSSALVATDPNNDGFDAAYNIATTPESKGSASIRSNR